MPTKEHRTQRNPLLPLSLSNAATMTFSRSRVLAHCPTWVCNHLSTCVLCAIRAWTIARSSRCVVGLPNQKSYNVQFRNTPASPNLIEISRTGHLNANAALVQALCTHVTEVLGCRHTRIDRGLDLLFYPSNE
eukprot:2415340-Amphidinium_carterae.1